MRDGHEGLGIGETAMTENLSQFNIKTVECSRLVGEPSCQLDLRGIVMRLRWPAGPGADATKPLPDLLPSEAPQPQVLPPPQGPFPAPPGPQAG
jgi:hypothetical protein